MLVEFVLEGRWEEILGKLTKTPILTSQHLPGCKIVARARVEYEEAEKILTKKS